MLHSAILTTFIKLPFAITTFVLSISKWPFKTGFTVQIHEHLFFLNRLNIMDSDGFCVPNVVL